VTTRSQRVSCLVWHTGVFCATCSTLRSPLPLLLFQLFQLTVWNELGHCIVVLGKMNSSDAVVVHVSVSVWVLQLCSQLQQLSWELSIIDIIIFLWNVCWGEVFTMWPHMWRGCYMLSPVRHTGGLVKMDKARIMQFSPSSSPFAVVFVAYVSSWNSNGPLWGHQIEVGWEIKLFSCLCISISKYLEICPKFLLMSNRKLHICAFEWHHCLQLLYCPGARFTKNLMNFITFS